MDISEIQGLSSTQKKRLIIVYDPFFLSGIIFLMDRRVLINVILTNYI